jgi:hypothetical protein
VEIGGKPRRRWIFRTIAVALLLLLIFFLDSMGFSILLVRVTGDAMDWRSHYSAGLFSTNCGRVPVRQDASKATECALKAYSEGRAFRVAYNIQGIDSTVAGGIVRTRDGQLLSLSFDGCPSGCGFSMLQQRVSISSCPKPYHLYVNPKGRLNCFQQQLSYPSNIMSPNFEPY